MGENLKQVTRYPKTTAKILDCSEQLIYLLHEFLGMLESLESQNADELENWESKFLNFSNTISVSSHSYLLHSIEQWLTLVRSPDTFKPKGSRSESSPNVLKRQ